METSMKKVKARIVNGIFYFLLTDNISQHRVRGWIYNHETGKFEQISVYTSPYLQDCVDNFNHP